MKSIPFLLLPLLLSACLNDAPDEPPMAKLPVAVRAVEAAHRKADFLGHETVAFEMELHWRDKPVLQADIVQRTDGTRIRIRKTNGSDAVFDGNDAWLAGPADPDARFDLFSWHYFFCLPWKLTDPGARWQPMPDRVFEKMSCSSGRLSFAPGTGDSSDDWFLVFSDKDQGLLRGAVYVVTFGGRDIETAGKTPRVVQYSDFKPVDGIPVAHAWQFYSWNTDSLSGKKELGTAVIRKVQFADETPEMFAVPAGARRI